MFVTFDVSKLLKSRLVKKTPRTNTENNKTNNNAGQILKSLAIANCVTFPFSIRLLVTTKQIKKKKTLTGNVSAFLWAKNIQYLKHGRQLLWEP